MFPWPEQSYAPKTTTGKETRTAVIGRRIHSDALCWAALPVGRSLAQKADGPHPFACTPAWMPSFHEDMFLTCSNSDTAPSCPPTSNPHGLLRQSAEALIPQYAPLQARTPSASTRALTLTASFMPPRLTASLAAVYSITS